jgi:SOS response regulatory protein OraA/RecX
MRIRLPNSGASFCGAPSPPTRSPLSWKSFREYSFVDDQKFSDLFAASRLQNSGFGRMRVLQDLRAKQVSPAVAEKAVAKVFEGTDEHALIQQFLDRKYRSVDLKTLASAYRRL